MLFIILYINLTTIFKDLHVHLKPSWVVKEKELTSLYKA